MFAKLILSFFDVPITIKDNDQPIGTHLYLAMQPEADGNRLRWLSLTIPEPNEDQGERNNKRRHRRDQEDETPKLDRVADHGVNQVTASAALDRIDIPQDVSNKVSELLWTGASLTVSDRAMSDEVDDSTDFIVLTR